MITIDQIRVKLQEAIKTSGLTNTEIARCVGVIHQAISQYLSGRAMPSLETFANLCAVLDVDPADILCIDSYKAD